ncbi:hypothetical protein [Mucilaginibacter sp.]
MQVKHVYCIGLLVTLMACGACNRSGNNSTAKDVHKGLYSFGPEVKSFKDCSSDHEYWVEDKSNRLEMEYAGMGFEKPYEPVYVEVEGEKIPSGKEGKGSEYDTTLVVHKLIKITREIPQECN